MQKAVHTIVVPVVNAFNPVPVVVKWMLGTWAGSRSSFNQAAVSGRARSLHGWCAVVVPCKCSAGGEACRGHFGKVWAFKKLPTWTGQHK